MRPSIEPPVAKQCFEQLAAATTEDTRDSDDFPTWRRGLTPSTEGFNHRGINLAICGGPSTLLTVHMLLPPAASAQASFFDDAD